MFDEKKYKDSECEFTEYKKIRKEFVTEAELLKYFIESSEDMISIHDSDGKYLYFCGHEESQISISDVIGKTPFDFFEKDTAHNIVGKIKKTAETGEGSKFEIKTEWFGKETWFEEKTFPVIKNQKVVSVIKICRDITGKKKAEQELRQQKIFFEKIVNSFAHPLYVINAETYEIEFTNDFALREKLPYGIKCFAYAELNSKPCSEKNKACPVTLLKYSDEPVVTEYMHTDNKGNKRFYEIHGFPVKNEDGKLIKVIEYNIDITEKKQIKEELIKAKEKAEESEKLKSAFLANMSHEIRTPLNGIIGFGELLKTPDISAEKQNYYIDIINKSGEHLLKLINDIIDVSKLDAGQVKIAEHKCSIKKIKEEIYEAFEPLLAASKKNIQFIVDDTEYGGKDFIYTDSLRLKQILFNITGNAIKFTTEGFVKIKYILNTENMIEFSVSDTGIGIGKEEVKHIFKRFTQANKDTARLFSGTGLGLTISKSLTELLGGKISVISEKGKGSVFKFTVPYKPV